MPESFRAAIVTVKDAVNELGRAALEAVIAGAESSDDVVQHEGERYRSLTDLRWRAAVSQRDP